MKDDGDDDDDDDERRGEFSGACSKEKSFSGM